MNVCNESIYKMNFKSGFSHLWQVAIPVAIFCFIPFALYNRIGEESEEYAFIATIVPILLLVIPSLIIHFKYWLVSRDVEINFDRENKVVKYKGKHIETKFKVADIQKIDTNVSKSKFNDDWRGFSWDNYCYSYIHLKTGDKLLVTSLIIPELWWPIKMPGEDIKSSFLCWPPNIK